MSAPSESTSASSGSRRRSRSPARIGGGCLQPLPEPDRARPAPAERGDLAADRQGLAHFRRGTHVQAGILEDRHADSGVRAAVLADPELAERQKQVLLEIYDSFRRETALDAGPPASGSGDGPGPGRGGRPGPGLRGGRPQRARAPGAGGARRARRAQAHRAQEHRARETPSTGRPGRRARSGQWPGSGDGARKRATGPGDRSGELRRGSAGAQRTRACPHGRPGKVRSANESQHRCQDRDAQAC